MASENRVTMDKLYQSAIAQGASDIHILPGRLPMLRVHGRLIELKSEPITGSAALGLFRDVASDYYQSELDTKGMVDLASTYSPNEKTSRTFRIHAAKSMNGVAIVARLVPQEAPKMEEIGLNKEFIELLDRPTGLILVTGPTGSGKSTTLASVMNYISTELGRAISTLEQPIEYQIKQREFGQPVSAVLQMEIPIHVASFAEALRGILRQDPDVIMVSELRDYETMEAALHAAETGHIVFSTMHTNSAPESIDRFVDVFPPDKQEQVRTVLASVLLGVMSQRLLPRVGGKGRVMAYELLLRHSSLPNLITKRQTARLADLIQTNQKAGMQAFDDHLYRLVVTEQIDRKNALEVARNREGLASKFKGIGGHE